MSKYFRWLEVRERDDVDVWEGTTRWGNHDIYPVPVKERNYGMLGFYSYFAAGAVNVQSFTAASAYVSAGLATWDTVGAICLGSCIAAANAWFGSRVGVDTALGFTMMNRATFGLWGAVLPIVKSGIASVVFAGINAFYGGQAASIILSAVIPQFHNLENTLPASAAITTKELIGFLIYFLFYGPICWFVPMHAMRKYLYPSIVITVITFFGMLGWVIHANGGTGPIISSAVRLTSTQRAFLFLQCTSSTAATWSGTGDRFTDWTRFTKSKRSATISVITGIPIFLTLSATIGVLVTSAFYQLYGTAIWNPLQMMLHVQSVQYTPACRAGTFLAGVGLFSSQIYSNVTLNTVGFAIDWVGIMPRYATTRRTSLIIVTLALVINPWRFLTQAVIFIQVLNVFAVLSACTAILLVADYWVIRKRMWKVPDLYHENGIYWFTNGWNWRAVAAWVIGVIPSIPGFVCSMIGGKAKLRPEYKIYQMTFFVGYPLSFIVFVVLNKIWPPEGLGIKESLPGYDHNGRFLGDVIEGVATEPGESKEMAVTTGEKAKSEVDV